MADKKKNFYAVVKGRRPGIYRTWTGAGGAEEQIKGFPGAVFKGFASLDEAEMYLKTGGREQPALFDQPAGQGAQKGSAAGTGAAVSPSRQASGRPAGWDAYKADLALGKVVIFTDGASTNNPGPGGYGVVILNGDERKELSGGFRRTTNNRMELMAVIVGLQSLKRRSQVVIYSDSSYVVQGIEKGWARRWKANNWMRAPGASGVSQPAENVDLWSALLDLLDQHDVEFRWVRGHASHPENERCDEMAVKAAHASSLPEDSGYQSRGPGRSGPAGRA